MIPGGFSSSAFLAPLVNHLWQSTAVACAAWLLALALRNNRAGVRYWLWMIASLKFLLPFSLLIAAGEWLKPVSSRPIQGPALTSFVEQFTEPLAQPQSPVGLPTAETSANSHLLLTALFTLWACGAFALAFRWWRKWRQVRSAACKARPLTIAAGLPVLLSQSLLEPGVFGVFRPVLLLPDGIADHLTQSQVSAIIAHEECHVRRRDNLTFAMHMAVETLFWFHPLVWWIGAHLVEERERACDEAVLQSGNKAEVYAEGILNVCKLYFESPLACASGVSGSDLKKRIVRIMTKHVAQRLNLSRKILLAAAAFAAMAIPVTVGLLHAAQVRAQAQSAGATARLSEFEVATVRPSKPSDVRGSTFSFTPNYGISVTNGTLKGLIEMAYDVRDFQISGGPGWVNSKQFNIVAKSSTDSSPGHGAERAENTEEVRLRLQALLADRFQLKVRRETKELPVYVLTVNKGSSRLVEADATSAPDSSPPGINAACGRMTGTQTSMANLAYKLSRQLYRPVIDQTGLAGKYSFLLSWTPDSGPCSAPVSGSNPEPASGTSDGPSIFTAIEEQLGLKLESQKGPVEVLVIDHVEQPSAN
jgi:bla regulator protein blaR1